MVHTDKIVRDLEFVYEGVFDFKEVLSLLKSYFKRNDYDLDEKLYDTKIKTGLKNIKLRWECDRRLDDYNKALAKLVIDVTDAKEAYVDGVKVVEGKLKITFNGEMERDYDLKWKPKPVLKFTRALYEKYISEEKQTNVDAQLKNLIDKLIKELKQYFKA